MTARDPDASISAAVPEPAASTKLRLTLCATRDAAWDAARSNADGLPHFGDGWIAYREAQGYRAAWLLATNAFGVAWIKQPRFRPWKRPTLLVDRLPAPLAGAAGATATSDALARALLDVTRAGRFGELAIESFDGPSPPPDLAALGFAVRERLE